MKKWHTCKYYTDYAWIVKDYSPKGGPFSPIPGPGVGRTLGAAEPVREEKTRHTFPNQVTDQQEIL